VPEGKYDVVIVLQPLVSSQKKRKAGFSQIKFIMNDDFNAPLEDLKEYM
jgi:Pyruvate/2-oxoacid:ferredoxin oxidoreductase gamma subunit